MKILDVILAVCLGVWAVLEIATICGLMGGLLR